MTTKLTTSLVVAGLGVFLALAGCDSGSNSGGECGDGVLDSSETCDGSNVGNARCTDHGFYGGTLGCAADCGAIDTSSCVGQCGDDTINGGEFCDGSDLAGVTCLDFAFYAGSLGCLTDCSDYDFSGCSRFCGDTVVDTADGEQCDDGNITPGDGCDANCQIEVNLCGNSTIDPGEQCDDGNTTPGDGCDANCQLEPNNCGDGNLDPGEGCDDGNLTSGDGCDAQCQIEAPGVCGDGNVDLAQGEQCDDGNTAGGDGCDASCQIEPPPACGDGNLDLAQGEQCDDGNTVAGDGCSPACQFEPVGQSCGDGNLDPLEVCDDGNTAGGDTCNSTCNLTNTTTLFAGSPGNPGWVDGIGPAAQLSGWGVLAADTNYLYYADSSNFVVRRIEVATADVQTIAGDPAGGYVDDPNGLNARFQWVETLTTDGLTLWVGSECRIRAIDLTSPTFAVTTVAGAGCNNNHVDGNGLNAEFDDLRGMVYYNGFVYLLDGVAATLRRLDPATGDVVTLAGQPYVQGTTDGFGAGALFQSPRYMASNNSGILYIADTNGNKIRAFNTVTSEVTTFAGDGTQGYVDAVGTNARIDRPRGMTSDGTSVYWSEFNQHTIRQGILASRDVSTVVGTPGANGYNEGVGNAALMDNPVGMAFHYPTNSLFFVDAANAVIRRIQ